METKALAEALRTHEPWLEWAGKREAKSFDVDPVAPDDLLAEIHSARSSVACLGAGEDD